MTCGKFKGIPIQTELQLSSFGSHVINFFPKEARAKFGLLPENYSDEQRYESLLVRDKDIVGYIATSIGTVYLGNDSTMLSLTGRELEAQVIGAYTTQDESCRFTMNPSTEQFFKITGVGVCGVHMSGNKKYNVEYLNEDRLFLTRGEHHPSTIVSGFPVAVTCEYANEMFQHFQRIGYKPKAIIFTTSGVYLRRIGSSKFERSL